MKLGRTAIALAPASPPAALIIDAAFAAPAGALFSSSSSSRDGGPAIAGIAHKSNSAVGYLLAAAAVVVILAVAFSVLAIARLFARSINTVPDEENASAGSDGLANACTTHMAKELEGAALDPGAARLVLLPGEREPRMVALPTPLRLAIVVHHPTGEAALVQPLPSPAAEQ